MKTWSKEERYRVLKSADEIKALHERTILSDYRQHYHIQSVTGLLNDPNGFVFHDGVWHLFYQWCPWGAVHGLKYWYHTTSENLVQWTNEGVCIRPDTEFDNKGAYSGSALPTSDALYLYYTGNHRDEDWTRKSYTCLVNLMDDGTPVKLPPLFGPNADYTEHQRDPKIIEQNGKYYIILGAQTKDKKGCVIIYTSDSPTEGWHFAGQLKVPGFEDFGDMWECPSIETISGYDVLIFCPQHLKLQGRGGSVHHSGYLLGHMDWENLTFRPDNTSFHVLDFGFDSYAAECAANPHDRNKATLVAWMGLPDASYPTDEEDWSGCLTLPRELRVRDRRLIQQPLDELRALRGEKLDLETTHPQLYAKLDKAYHDMARHAEYMHWLWEGYDNGYYEYDDDELMEYCERECGFFFEYDENDYLDANGDFDEEEMGYAKSKAFHEWLDDYLRGLSDDDVVKFMGEHMDAAVDIDDVEYTVSIPEDIIQKAKEQNR